MTTTTKFEPESVVDSSTLSSSLSTTMSTRNPYWNEWELAAMAMGRTNDGGQFLINNTNNNNIQQQQQQQQNNSAYYGQMVAVMSAASNVNNNVNIGGNNNIQNNWYPVQNYNNYYGLGNNNIQRNSLINNNCGYPGIYFPQDYYNNTLTGNYYASAKVFAAAAAQQYGNIQQQQQNNCSNNNILSLNKYSSNNLMDLQTINTGSELDTSSPSLITLNNSSNLKASSLNNSQKLNNKTKNKILDKSSLGRSKKKKITTITNNNQEINQTRVLVWELEDVCSIIPNNNSYKIPLEQMLTVELMKLLKYGFNLDNFDDFDQANIMDAQMDEALQNAANCNTNSTINIPSTSSFSEELSNNIIENNNSLITSNSNKNISSATDGLRKLAEKCRNIRNIFEQNRDINTFIELLQHCQIDSNKLLNYMNKIEEFPDSNTKLFRECLSVISKRSPLLPYKYVNVILSFNQIECGVAGVLGRLMLCRMSEFIEAENVFCITRNGKEAVFERLINQFQKKLILLITTSEESRKIANKNGILCWFLYSNDDLFKLRKALDILTDNINIE
ncbi:hypothetical protein Mgra_00008872 [Meloidogyne graminicola]|uniref:Eyes absent homolog n=1 Tax=Meloidogyne graminicola TaxID=189291 RepID=A0A8S9ZEN0_9BILA|nr:hypothetical protein Mgra_00008872 [Meloidogyne graminicola]